MEVIFNGLSTLPYWDRTLLSSMRSIYDDGPCFAVPTENNLSEISFKFTSDQWVNLAEPSDEYVRR